MMDESAADTGEPQSTIHEIRLELFERERELFERQPRRTKPQSLVHEKVDDTWLDAVLAGVLARNDLLGSTPGARDNFAAAGGWDKDSFAAPAAAPLFHAPLPTPPRVSSLKEYEVRALAAAASSTPCFSALAAASSPARRAALKTMFRADRAQLGVLEPPQVEHVLRSWDRAAAEGRDDYWTRCERDAAPLGCAAAPSPGRKDAAPPASPPPRSEAAEAKRRRRHRALIVRSDVDRSGKIDLNELLFLRTLYMMELRLIADAEAAAAAEAADPRRQRRPTVVVDADESWTPRALGVVNDDDGAPRDESPPASPVRRASMARTAALGLDDPTHASALLRNSTSTLHFNALDSVSKRFRASAARRFARLDVRKEGRLTFAEVKPALRELESSQWPLSSKGLLLAAFNSVDLDGDGHIDFNEWVALLIRVRRRRWGLLKSAALFLALFAHVGRKRRRRRRGAFRAAGLLLLQLSRVQQARMVWHPQRSRAFADAADAAADAHRAVLRAAAPEKAAARVRWLTGDEVKWLGDVTTVTPRREHRAVTLDDWRELVAYVEARGGRCLRPPAEVKAMWQTLCGGGKELPFRALRDALARIALSLDADGVPAINVVIS